MKLFGHLREIYRKWHKSPAAVGWRLHLGGATLREHGAKKKQF